MIKVSPSISSFFMWFILFQFIKCLTAKLTWKSLVSEPDLHPHEVWGHFSKAQINWRFISKTNNLSMTWFLCTCSLKYIVFSLAIWHIDAISFKCLYMDFTVLILRKIYLFSSRQLIQEHEWFCLKCSIVVSFMILMAVFQLGKR